MARSALRVRASDAVADDRLQRALQNATDRFALGRGLATMSVNWEELREAARSIRAGIMSRLPDVLSRLADTVQARGGHVLWAADAAEANEYIAGVAARTGTKLA